MKLAVSFTLMRFITLAALLALAAALDGEAAASTSAAGSSEAAASTNAAAAAAACAGVEYAAAAPGEPPLLLGGSFARCRGAKCSPTTGAWGDTCSLDPSRFAAWGVCEREQGASIMEAVRARQRERQQQQQQQNSNSGTPPLPPLLDPATFSPCDLVRWLGDRTLWLVGDSHVKGLYYSARCALLHHWDTRRGECAASASAAAQRALDEASARGHGYPTAPRCVHVGGGAGRVCLVHSPLGTEMTSGDPARPGTLQLLSGSSGAFAQPGDVVAVSVGRWHANGCEGVHPSYADALDKIGAWAKNATSAAAAVTQGGAAGGAAGSSRGLEVLFVVAPMDHTPCSAAAAGASAPTPSDPKCPAPGAPGADYSTAAWDEVSRMAREVLGGRWGVAVLDHHLQSRGLPGGHIAPRQSIDGRRDCLHYCRAGWGELELFNIVDASSRARQGAAQPPASQAPQAPRACVPLPAYLPPPWGARPPGSVGPSQVEMDVWGRPMPVL